MKLTPQYLAGMIDADGWIMIRESHESFLPIIGLQIRQRFLLEVIREQYGGTLTDVKPSSPDHAPTARWWLTGFKPPLLFLDDIEPYLWLKATQARIVREFAATRPGIGRRADETANAAALAYFLRMKEENRKGVEKREPKTRCQCGGYLRHLDVSSEIRLCYDYKDLHLTHEWECTACGSQGATNLVTTVGWRRVKPGTTTSAKNSGTRSSAKAVASSGSDLPSPTSPIRSSEGYPCPDCGFHPCICTEPS